MVNFVWKFPNICRHGNRGSLTQISLTQLNRPTPKTPYTVNKKYSLWVVDAYSNVYNVCNLLSLSTLCILIFLACTASAKMSISLGRDCVILNKKAQLSLNNPRDAKACQKLLQFDVLTTLSLTILAYLHSFSCCCVRNVRNPAKFTENLSLWSSRSSKVIDLGVNRKPICDLLLVISSNFSRICYRFRDIHG